MNIKWAKESWYKRIKSFLFLSLVIVLSVLSTEYLTFLDTRSRHNLPFLLVLGLLLGYYVCSPGLRIIKNHVRPSVVIASSLVLSVVVLYTFKHNSPGPAIVKWFFFALGNVYYLALSHIFKDKLPQG